MTATSQAEQCLQAKQRELAAHVGVVELHEQAAALQERLGHSERAAAARVHGQQARE